MRGYGAIGSGPRARSVRDGDGEWGAPVPSLVRARVQLQRARFVLRDVQTLRVHRREVELRVRVATRGAALEVLGERR